MGNANDVIALLAGLNTVELEEVLRKTLKAIIQLNYRELMSENEELKSRIEDLEAERETMLEAMQMCDDYRGEVDEWIEHAPVAPDLSDYV